MSVAVFESEWLHALLCGWKNYPFSSQCWAGLGLGLSWSGTCRRIGFALVRGQGCLCVWLSVANCPGYNIFLLICVVPG